MWLGHTLTWNVKGLMPISSPHTVSYSRDFHRLTASNSYELCLPLKTIIVLSCSVYIIDMLSITFLSVTHTHTHTHTFNTHTYTPHLDCIDFFAFRMGSEQCKGYRMVEYVEIHFLFRPLNNAKCAFRYPRYLCFRICRN